jgi:gluconolactonase
MLFLPGGMVHSGMVGEVGVDQLDVFGPVRPDYVERAKRQQALYETVIAPGVRPRRLAEGFTFTEGATWLNGKLYFSDMWFKNPAAGDWTGSPARSRLMVLEPAGHPRVVAAGMQSNGTVAARHGNLIVCDMFGHRVVELDPATGRVVRVLLDKIAGRPIDGPNDLVMDARGGLYITDPQFTPEARKSQPGPQVYYLNKRHFAWVTLEPMVLDAPNPADRFDSGADGSAVDADGRYYVATRAGVQIFLPDGTAAGTIRVPQYPVSVTFGGANNDVLYMVGESSVWSIQTKVRGFRHPSGMN